ncbi:OsmC family protein [Streptomyces venezuelae]|uniref:OsmC family protein n=1 Tax=Streptomyces venezuelae TaxID=54571 RepID=UPI00379E00AF
MKDLVAGHGPRTLHPKLTGSEGRVDVNHVAGQTYAVYVREHELVVSQPRDAGGDDDGPTPVELFVSSLATCVAYYAGRFLERHRLPYDNLEVRAEFDMAGTPPARVETIRMRILLPKRLPARQYAALRAVVDHCTVHNSLRTPPEIMVTAD